MSATTTDQQESRGFVGETVQRPIQEAVREGVRQALQEQADVERRGGSRSSSDEDDSGRSWFAILTLLGIGMAAFLLWRRRGGDSGDGGTTESIRSRSKTDESERSDSGSSKHRSGPAYSSSGSETGDDTDEMTEESDEADAAPEAGSE